ATANSGQQRFIDQLTQNVKAGAATALIKTAINGGNVGYVDETTQYLRLNIGNVSIKADGDTVAADLLMAR
ncbi:MAG: hypothetical protein V4636_00570, partial [Pseudomonadota bacterium]